MHEMNSIPIIAMSICHLFVFILALICALKSKSCASILIASGLAMKLPYSLQLLLIYGAGLLGWNDISKTVIASFWTANEARVDIVLTLYLYGMYIILFGLLVGIRKLQIIKKQATQLIK